MKKANWCDGEGTMVRSCCGQNLLQKSLTWSQRQSQDSSELKPHIAGAQLADAGRPAPSIGTSGWQMGGTGEGTRALLRLSMVHTMSFMDSNGL